MSTSGVGVYIHIPFCQVRCSYCDFNTYAGLGHLIDAYVSALCREIERVRETHPHPGPLPGREREQAPSPFEGEGWDEGEAGAGAGAGAGRGVHPHPGPLPGRERESARPRPAKERESARLRADTIYLGGGTPSLLSEENLERILHACREAFDVAPDAEITIEANPGTVTGAALLAMRCSGVNRLSLGVQSLDDAMLRALDRLHNADEARSACRLARQAGFANISLDFMYGLPGQSLEHWRVTLSQALELRPEHLSLYALTLEEHTPMARRVAAGDLLMPDDDSVADMYTLAEDMLDEAGFVHYEISNWAACPVPIRQGDGAGPALASRHNLIYWRRRPYLGFGAGAHSFDGRRRYANVLHPQEYIRRINTGRPSGDLCEEISPQAAMSETMFLGLRLLQCGVTADDFIRQHGRALDVYSVQINELSALGLLEYEGGRLRLTRRGRLLSNQAFMRFV